MAQGFNADHDIYYVSFLWKYECHYNIGLNIRGPFNNHRSLFFHILAHTRLYRTECTQELMVLSQFITFSLYFAWICKDRVCFLMFSYYNFFVTHAQNLVWQFVLASVTSLPLHFVIMMGEALATPETYDRPWAK